MKSLWIPAMASIEFVIKSGLLHLVTNVTKKLGVSSRIKLLIHTH